MSNSPWGTVRAALFQLYTLHPLGESGSIISTARPDNWISFRLRALQLVLRIPYVACFTVDGSRVELYSGIFSDLKP